MIELNFFTIEHTPYSIPWKSKTSLDVPWCDSYPTYSKGNRRFETYAAAELLAKESAERSRLEFESDVHADDSLNPRLHRIVEHHIVHTENVMTHIQTWTVL